MKKQPNIKNSIKKNSAIEAFIVTLIVIGAVGYFVIKPQVVGYFDLRKQITASQDQAAELNATADKLQSIDLTTVKNQLTTVNQVLPDHPDLIAAMNQIQQTVSDNNLKLNTLTYSPNALDDSSTGPGKAYNFSIAVTGSVGSFRSLVLALKSSPLVSQVTAINLSSSTDADKTQTTYGLNFYYLAISDSSSVETTELNSTEQTTLTALQDRVSTQSAVPSDTITGPRGKSNPFQ